MKHFLAHLSPCVALTVFFTFFFYPLQSNLASFLKWNLSGRGDLWEIEVSRQIWPYPVSFSCSEAVSWWVKDFPPSSVRNQEWESQILKCFVSSPHAHFWSSTGITSAGSSTGCWVLWQIKWNSFRRMLFFQSLWRRETWCSDSIPNQAEAGFEGPKSKKS